MYMERERVILHADTRSSHHNTGRYLRLRRSNTQEKKMKHRNVTGSISMPSDLLK